MMGKIIDILEFVIMVIFCVIAWVIMKHFGLVTDLAAIVAGAALYRAVQARNGR